MVGYEVDFEKGNYPVWCGKKDFVSSILKGISLVYDIHNLMPIRRGECPATYQRISCTKSHKHNTESRNSRTFTKSGLWLSFIELLL